MNIEYCHYQIRKDGMRSQEQIPWLEHLRETTNFLFFLNLQHEINFITTTPVDVEIIRKTPRLVERKYKGCEVSLFTLKDLVR